MTLFEYIGYGPIFLYLNDNLIVNPLKDYWWTVIFFIQNLVPWSSPPNGLYWLFPLANDLQMYAFAMMPSIYYYLLKGQREVVLGVLTAIVFGSTTYIFLVVFMEDLSSMLQMSDSAMFNQLYRRPFGPLGYYALGIMFAIFYYEYQ